MPRYWQWKPLSILRNTDLQSRRPEDALARYRQYYPEFFERQTPRIDMLNVNAAVDLALVLQEHGDEERARLLLDGARTAIEGIPRLGDFGHGITDVQIHALRGEKAKALAALRQAAQAGWRGQSWRSLSWLYYRDFDPNLASIRNEPEFKAAFADIERDMATQRAVLAARPKDAPLELAETDT